MARNLFANGIPPLPGEAQQSDTSQRQPRNLFANGIPTLPGEKATLGDTVAQSYDDTKAGEMLNLNRGYRETLPELEQRSAEAGPLTKWFYDLELNRSRRGLGETEQWLQQYGQRSQNRPINPTLQKINQAETFGDVGRAIAEHPLDAVTHGVASSAIPSALSLGNAFVASRMGGMPAAVTTAGLTSADIEYKSGIMQGLQEAGVNVSDPTALGKALSDPTIMNEIERRASQKAAVVGAFDAASMGVAGKQLAAGPVKNLALQGGVQASMGAGGEAAGSLYSGQEVKPGAVALEALGELPGSVGEVAIASGKKAFTGYPSTSTTSQQQGNVSTEQPQGETVNIYADQQPQATGSSDDMGSIVSRMIGAESAGKANAKNPYSSAEGLGQFIDSTWLSMIRKHRPDIANGKSDEAILALKTDPALSREMTTRYAEDNAADLRASGFEATGRNIYLSHHFGIGGARTLLRADPGLPVSSVVSAQVIQQNPYMRGKTVGQVLNIIENKMGDSAGTVTTSSQTQPVNSAITEEFQQTTPDTDLQAGMDAGQQTETQLDIQPVDEVQPTEMADIPAVTGEPSRIRSEDGQWHDADYQVVEADALNSTTDQAENQYRDRNRAGLAEQVRGIANDLQYDLVSKSPVMEYGAPVVGRDGSVIAGNGRLSGIQQAYKGEGAADYKARLQADAASLGIDPQQVAGMRNPVLIRRLKNDIKPTAQPADLPLQQVIGQPQAIPSEQVISNSLPQPYTSPPTMQAQAVGRGVQANAGLGQAGIVGTEAQPAISVADVEQSRGMEPVVSGQGKQLTDGNQQYSEQPAATGNTTENVTAELSRAVGANRIKRLMHLGRLKVVQSASELSGGTANMAGMYDSATDSVTLVADHIPEGGALGVFLHESGEHAGFKSILGNKYQFIVGQFNKLLQEQNPYAVRAVERVPGDTPAEHVDSERLAYLIEDVTNSQDTGTAYNRARAFVNRVIAAVRAWAVQKLPAWIGPKSLSPADIQALAVRAALAWADNSSSKPADSEQMNETRSENGNSEQVKYSIASAIGSALKSQYEARQRDGWLQLGRYYLNNLVIAPHEAIRDIGTPAAQALADLIRRPLSNEKSPETGALDDLNVASYARQGEYSTKLDDILAPIRGRRGLKKQDMAALVSGLHTGIVPANLADTARKLRSWLDELRDYQLAAGLDFGYVQHYFPRVYDIKKVTNNHKAFTDMLEKNGYSPEVASDIAARIINGDTLPEMQLNTSNRLIVGNNKIGTFNSRDKGKEGHAGKSSHQKSRVLDIPYDELAPFMENNLEHILNRYMGNAIKRAEYARKFGPNEEILNKLVADMVDEMETLPSEVKGRLNTQQAVQLAYDVADMQQGAFRNPSTNKLGVAVRTILNLQVMIKLPLAVLSSAPDFVAPALLSGNTRQWLAAVVRGTGDSVYEGLRAMDKAVTGKHHLKQSDMYRYTEELGINTNAAIQDAIDSLYFAGDSSVDLLSVGVRKFMHLTFQEQTMRLQKVIATRTFLGSVRRWAADAGSNKHSATMLQDFGIDPAQASAWAAGGFQNDPMMQFAINRAAIRFSNSAVTTPDRSNRSLLLQDKSGIYPLIFQFQSFSNAFGNTLIPRIAQQFVRAKGDKAELLPVLKMVTAMAAMMALAFGAQELRDWWKYGEKKPYKDDSKNDPLRRVANSFDRAGFTGMFSKAFEFFSPYKFGYGEQGGARIAGLFGPTITDLGKFVDAFMIEQASEEAQAKKQAKFIANMTPGANALPYETKQEYMVKPLTNALR